MRNSLLLQSFCALLTGAVWAPPIGAAWIAVLGCVWLCVFVAALVACVRPWAEPAVHAAALAGSLWLGVAAGSLQPHDPGLPGSCSAQVQGIVREAVEWQPGFFADENGTQVVATFMLDVTAASFAGAPETAVYSRVRCTLASCAPIGIERGDAIAVSGTWVRLPAATNPGQFDVAAYFACFGVYYRFCADAGDVCWLPPSRPGPLIRLERALDRVRSRAATVLAAPVGYEAEGSIIRNMLLGTREALPDDVIESFLRTGTFHIIAISGMHIGIMFGLWWSVAWLVGIPGRFRGVAVLPLIWLYGLMAGMGGSIVRSVLMFSALALAPLLARPHRAAHTLLAVAFIYVVFWPSEMRALGTQLTFISVAALLVVTPLFDATISRWRWVRGPAVYDLEHQPWRRLHAVIRYFLHIACGTFAIWLATWPVTLTRGNLVSPASWLANLLIVPLASVSLAGGFLTLLVAAVAPGVATWLNAGNVFLMHLMVRIMDAVGMVPGGCFAVRTLTGGLLFWYYLGLLTWCAWAFVRVGTDRPQWLSRAMGSAAAVCSVVFLSFVVVRHDAGAPLRVAVLDVGLGDALVLHAPDGATALVDGGGRAGPWSAGARVVVPYLRAVGVDRLDAVICSHFDRDHAGGLVAVLNAVRVRRVIAPPVPADVSLAAELRALAAARGIEWIEAHAGDRFAVGCISGLVLHPPAVVTSLPPAAVQGGNLWSLAVRFDCRGRSFLASGDAPSAAEAVELCRGAPMASDVLKLAHHGSAGATSERYLDAVAPAAAVLSVGPNSKGLPAATTLERLACRAVPVARTDCMGACLIRFRPDDIMIDCWK